MTTGDKEMMLEQRATDVEAVARVCHEANRAWCEAHGDHTQKLWLEAEEWQRESAVKGVEAALEGITPEELHEAWMRTKWDEGWTWGPVKDLKLKRHPLMVPYDELSEMNKAKDVLFQAVVGALAPTLGLSGTLGHA